MNSATNYRLNVLRITLSSWQNKQNTVFFISEKY